MRAASLIVLLLVSTTFAEVKFGTDIIREDNFAMLKGKRVGLVANPASVDSRMRHTADNLRESKDVKLVALFGPEHGIYGDEYAGKSVKDSEDKTLGVPTYSIYGKTRRPTTQMFKGVDTIVFDLQEIGARSYTVISSMKLCMDACNEHGVELVILDRPNPLGGERIEGPSLETKFESFVGLIHVPYVYGMTMGELAQLVREQDFPKYDKLKIVKMTGWKRNMIWDDTGKDWVQTSPNIPNAHAAMAYSMTGIAGELDTITIGAGYTLPFELFGAPWIDANALANHMNKSGKTFGQDGLSFRPIHFRPFWGKFADQVCEGVQMHFDARKVDNLVEINFRLLDALGAPGLRGDKEKRANMFDKVTGSEESRRWLAQHKNLDELFAKWRKECTEFREYRKKFLLY